jgi:hypothetical protein
MKVIAAIAIILASSCSVVAAQQQSYWNTLSLHHIRKSLVATTTKSIDGVKSIMHLGPKHSK